MAFEYLIEVLDREDSKDFESPEDLLDLVLKESLVSALFSVPVNIRLLFNEITDEGVLVIDKKKHSEIWSEIRYVIKFLTESRHAFHYKQDVYHYEVVRSYVSNGDRYTLQFSYLKFFKAILKEYDKLVRLWPAAAEGHFKSRYSAAYFVHLCNSSFPLLSRINSLDQLSSILLLPEQSGYGRSYGIAMIKFFSEDDDEGKEGMIHRDFRQNGIKMSVGRGEEKSIDIRLEYSAFMELA
jgi:hypothetical protein